MESKWQRSKELFLSGLTVLAGLALTCALFYGMIWGLITILEVIKIDLGDLLGKSFIALVCAAIAFLAAVVVQELKRSIEVRACIKKVAVLGAAISCVVSEGDRHSRLLDASVGPFLFTDEDLRNVVKFVGSPESLELIRITLMLKRLGELASDSKFSSGSTEDSIISELRKFDASKLKERLAAGVYFPPRDLFPSEHVLQNVEKLQ